MKTTDHRLLQFIREMNERNAMLKADDSYEAMMAELDIPIQYSQGGAQ